ncbi:hypothetical protein H7H37_11215 [Mycolicibacterium insubricum]|nr:hypothetical protein [Mycolicibacterium insubricum]
MGDLRARRGGLPPVRFTRQCTDGRRPRRSARAGLRRGGEPGAARRQRHQPLTEREREIALLVARGLSNRDIAQAMSLSVRTVEGHIYRATVKAGVTTRAELSSAVAQYPRLPVSG